MRRLWLLFAQAVTIALAVVVVLAAWKPQWWASSRTLVAAPALPAPAVAPALPARGATSTSFAAAVRRAAPAVVSITASKTTLRRAAAGAQQPWPRDFFNGRNQTQTGLGSGVLVSADGYLLTNQHVVDGADDIEVTLSDGRSASAKVVGTDADSDLALLKVSLDNVPVIPFGDIKQVSVGDPVLAIGNPFNVGETVTSGIVSALDRNQLGLSTIENFIQTDAAINPGNSGGALVDSEGRLVGINTAIFSRSGGSMGIGFAIPVDIAREVMDALIRDGQMTRGWIGVQPRDLTPEFADSFQLPVKEGVLVTGVLRDGPAAQAGLKPGDVVTAIGGVKISNTAQLLRAVGALKPPSSAVLAVQRGSDAMTLSVPVAKRPPARPRDADQN
ncbi:S1C family serine protease [Scleromatobacter humisilvae]|uniref:Trypsin-like peptidase domain-containing protein n=1 Tax=Scleromatobacter humisilvae TaxID=2897159 RepID=A0A9X1YIA2_9BURK|nr:trypsin-like peptidase domain-containing protein [Scleromatobacter humisilvae]MCK9684892.1 trypsin-like peptidase domain-containing protein [Scleromatobacter humisilvae]